MLVILNNLLCNKTQALIEEKIKIFAFVNQRFLSKNRDGDGDDRDKRFFFDIIKGLFG